MAAWRSAEALRASRTREASLAEEEEEEDEGARPPGPRPPRCLSDSRVGRVAPRKVGGTEHCGGPAAEAEKSEERGREEGAGGPRCCGPVAAVAAAAAAAASSSSGGRGLLLGLPRPRGDGWYCVC